MDTWFKYPETTRAKWGVQSYGSRALMWLDDDAQLFCMLAYMCTSGLENCYNLILPFLFPFLDGKSGRPPGAQKLGPSRVDLLNCSIRTTVHHMVVIFYVPAGYTCPFPITRGRLVHTILYRYIMCTILWGSVSTHFVGLEHRSGLRPRSLHWSWVVFPWLLCILIYMLSFFAPCLTEVLLRVLLSAFYTYP